MIVVIDNYDSFVYNIVRNIKELDEDVCVFRNNSITIEEIDAIRPSGIILSPGPKGPESTGICREIIKDRSDKIPILGICLGYQTIGHVYNAKITEAYQPMHGKLSVTYHDGKGLFRGIKNPFNATRYHSLIIDEKTLPSDFIVTCRTEQGEIMGIRHNKLYLEGVQFHPEAVLTESGYELMKNYIKWCKEIQGENK